MSLPASSAERNALVPVISTLLQLNPAEQKHVQTALKTPLWASLPVKDVKPRSATSARSDSRSAPSTAGADMDSSSRSRSSDKSPSLDRSDGRSNGAAAAASEAAAAEAPEPPPSSVAAPLSAMGSPLRMNNVEKANRGSFSPARLRAPVLGHDLSSAGGKPLNPLLDRSDTTDDIDLAQGSAVAEIHM
jgi:hypothetical protein